MGSTGQRGSKDRHGKTGISGTQHRVDLVLSDKSLESGLIGSVQHGGHEAFVTHGLHRFLGPCQCVISHYDVRGKCPSGSDAGGRATDPAGPQYQYPHEANIVKG